MSICPVCGMSIDLEKARYKTIYKGKIYYFCSRNCYNKFISKPDYYIEYGSENMFEE